MTAFHIGLERVIYDHAGDPVGIGFTIYDSNAPGTDLVRQLLALATSITPLRY